MTRNRIVLPYSEYRRKVLGCWLGKAVGGTLGQPHEGKTGTLNLTFYDPVPTEMIANDDLDLQVVWLQTIRRRGLPVDRRSLAQAWMDHIRLLPDEYGVCERNLAQHLFPSLSGAYDNGFTDGMGAAIRSEIWACLAPGDPALAASLAREDACVDHAGEGIHAETFFVTIESAAFVESDPMSLIEMGLGAIPSDCRVARAVRSAIEHWQRLHDWLAVRGRIVEEHGSQNFTDVPMNLAFVVLGWLAGEGDFGRAICTAVNCGMDTDCTGAILGAILGLMDPHCISEEWLAPIGRDLVLSPGMTGMAPPATLDELTDQTVDLAQQVLDYYGSSVVLEGAPPVQHPVRRRMAPVIGAQLSLERPADPRASLIATEPLAVTVHYPESVRIAPGRTESFRVELVNVTEKRADLTVAIVAPDGWEVGGTVQFEQNGLRPGEAASFEVEVAPREQTWRPHSSRLDVAVSLDGMTLTYSAGLLMTIPLLRWTLEGVPTQCPAPPAKAELVEAGSHFIDLAAFGAAETTQVFKVRFKMPYSACARILAQSARPVRVWLDEELLLDPPGGYEVPAIHRPGGTGADRDLQGRAYDLTLAVGPGQGPPGRLFFGVGEVWNWAWIESLEYQNPCR